MGWLEGADVAATAAINAWQCSAADAVMLFCSRVPVWIPLYCMVAFLLLKRLGWKDGLLAIAILGLTCLLTDQISHHLKESICRLRPCEDPTLAGIIRCVEKHGSLYGFPSGHACNTFGFAAASAPMLRRKHYTILIFIWATVVSYSRIYLGKHFLGDVVCGALLGVAIGCLMLLLFNRLRGLIRK